MCIRDRGKTKWVHVNAEAGGSIEVDPQMTSGQWVASTGVRVVDAEKGIFTVQMSPGDSVLFWPTDQPQPQTVVAPIEPRGKVHRFGLNK